jgi:hypothetical protein
LLSDNLSAGYQASTAGLVLRSRLVVSNATVLASAFGFTGRAQSSSPPFTPHRERASGKALAFIGSNVPAGRYANGGSLRTAALTFKGEYFVRVFSEDTAADEEWKKVLKKFQRCVRFPTNDRSVPARDQH